MLDGTAHSGLRLFIADDGIDILDHIVSTAHELAGTIHHVIHVLALCAIDVISISEKMILVIPRCNGHDFFAEQAVRRNRHFGIAGDFRPFFQFHGHIDAIAGRFYTFNLTDVDADIADGIPFLQAIGILEFRMDDKAGLTKDFGMSQGQDKGK